MMLHIKETETIDGLWKLPERWKWVRLANIITTKYGKALVRGKRDTQGKYVVFSSAGHIDQHSSSYTKAPVIVIGRKGTIGSHYFSLDPCWPIDTTIYMDKFPEHISPRYIYHFLKALDLQKPRKKQIRPGLTKEEIGNSPIPIPFPENPSKSLDIQNRIANYMEAVLKDIDECKRLLDTMRSDTSFLISAELEEIFGNKRDGFAVKNAPLEQVKKIEKIALEEPARGIAPRPRTDPRYFGGNTPWIEIHNLPKDYSKYITNYTKALSEEGGKRSRIFPQDTLVISIASSIGEVGILGFNASFPDSLVGIIPDQSIVDVGFLYWQFLFLRKQLEETARVATQKNINLQTFKPIELWIPPLIEQRAIDTHLAAVQSDINTMQEQLDKDTRLLAETERAAREQAYGRTS